MSDGAVKWILGVIGAVASTVSVAAIFAIFSMRDSINTMIAERPLRDQVRALENEQMRQAIQLNGQELDVVAMELNALEIRINRLENAP